MAGMVNNLLQRLHISSPKSNAEPPKEPDKEELQKLKEAYDKAGQGHVFHYWDELDLAGRASLFGQLSEINPQLVSEIVDKALSEPPKKRKKDDDDKEKEEEKEDKDGADTEDEIEPLPEDIMASVMDSSKEDLDGWYDQGLQLISENKVAVVLMAGGQGTRLGSSDPKGCFNIGLPSEKSLFQMQAERIVKLQELAASKHMKQGVTLPWYIMTSGPTRQGTEDYFEKHKYFGLAKENVTFFEQGLLPCFTNDKKILLEDKSKIATAPNGNGGIYQAMFLNSVIQDMSSRGIEHVQAYCVDNSLVRVADPTFIGFAAGKGADIATKVVRKRDAKESVGLIVQKGGKPSVVEYSEIAKELTEQKSGELLKFRAANIVNHYYSFSFLESAPQWDYKLPHHVAKKKIPYIDLDKDELVKPEKANGIKLEQFVFDCFPLVPMDKFACLEVRREEEFSPLKNAEGTGEDDPGTSKKAILAQGRRWLEAAGGVVVGENPEAGVEVSPLISYAGEGLEGMQGKTITAPAVMERDPTK